MLSSLCSANPRKNQERRINFPLLNSNPRAEPYPATVIRSGTGAVLTDLKQQMHTHMHHSGCLCLFCNLILFCLITFLHSNCSTTISSSLNNWNCALVEVGRTWTKGIKQTIWQLQTHHPHFQHTRKKHNLDGSWYGVQKSLFYQPTC